MASTRGVTSQLGRLAIRRETSPHACLQTAVATSFARALSTSPSSFASAASTASITAAANAPGPVVPLEERTVTATIHHFPSLEPLRFEPYPANHLHLPTRRDILHRAVIFEGDATRLGTASTKWRSEIHGSAKKIRPQKGSGRARLGDKKSPMLRGGGVAFGPKPRDFSSGLQKKVYDLAWRTALSYRYRKGELVIVDNALEIESPSAGLLRYIFNRHRWGQRDGRSILVTLEERPLLAKALAEVPKEGWTATWDQVDVKDMLSLGRIIIERKALQNILLSHQEDLVRSPFLPKLSKKLEPVELQRVLGWSEFQRLESATPEELPELQLSLYERLADKRLAQAGILDDAEAIQSKISAYELKSEATRLRVDALSRHEDLRHESSEDDDLRIQALRKRIETLGLQAERSEYKATALRLQGEDGLAADWEADAEYYRAEAEEKQTEVDELVAVEEAAPVAQQ